jgi:hypothetical protein
MKNFTKLVATIIVVLFGLNAVQAQKNLEYSFVTVGCNRVDDADAVNNSPSTANVYQINRLFKEVSELQPAPKYLFLTGDMVIGYTSDTLNLGKQLRGWIALYKASPLFGKSTKVVVIPGNHETQDKAAGKKSFVGAEIAFVREMKNFIIGNNGPVTTGLVSATDSLTTDQSKLTYSFDDSKDHFVIINTDPVGRDSRVAYRWIDNDIKIAKANGARHIFAFGHKPAYATVLKPTDGLVAYKWVRDQFWNTLETNNCEAMFAAHNHLWEKQQPHTDKTWQIIAGNGGSKLETGVTNPYYGYTLVNVFDNGEVVVESYGRDLNATNYSFAADANATTKREAFNINLPTGTLDLKTNTLEKNQNSLIITPNPFVDKANASFTIQESGKATVLVTDFQGKKIQVLVDQTLQRGDYSFPINTQNISSGAYFVTLIYNGKKLSTQKIIVTK